MRSVLSLAVFAGVAAALPQQQPPAQPQQQKQQPGPCTPDTLKGFMISSPVSVELLNNSQAILPDGAAFLDSSNTTILLQAEPKKTGETETLGGIKIKNDTDVSVELPQKSAFAISWVQQEDGQQPGQKQAAQQPAQTPAQQTPAQQTPTPQPAQLVQEMQAQQPQQDQPKLPSTQVLPTRLQMVDPQGNVRNVTEVISLFGTAEAADQYGEGGQPAVGAQQAPAPQQPAQPAPAQPAPAQPTPQQPAQPAQPPAGQPGQQQKAAKPPMPDNVGGVVAYIGPEVPPGTYSFLITAKVTKGGQQQAVASQQAGGQQQSYTCRILTHPIRVQHAVQKTG